MAVVVLLALLRQTDNMDIKFLQSMYQQWSQGNENAAFRYIDFIEMASKQTGIAQDQLMRELQKCYWFRREEQ